jgi:hypothetical protein
LDCICRQSHVSVSDSTLLETFEAVREKCPAIRELFVPDSIWPKFRAWHLRPDDQAYHVSILMLALQRGHLWNVTSPAHRYLFTSGGLSHRIRKQYVNDLSEQWMTKSDPMERHHKFKMFFGRFTELQCAQWLEEQGWTISNLEAFRQGSDIEAHTDNGNTTAFEVKFLGQSDLGFDSVARGLKGETGGAICSPYTGINYVLLRAYEAAKQLQRFDNVARIALIVIDEMAWFTLKRPLEDGWINWKNPVFNPNDPFIDKQREKNQKLDIELGPTLRTIDAVWILKGASGHRYEREYELLMTRS